jgi:hypothetical protein
VQSDQWIRGAIAELDWLYNQSEIELKRDVRSAESSWEAQLDARAKCSRHRPFAVRDGRGTLFLRGTDLRCGCSVHRHGAEYEGGAGIGGELNRATWRERRIRTALVNADQAAPHTDPPWSCPELPSVVLWARFGRPLSPDLAVFGAREAERIRATLRAQQAENKGTRERARLMAISLRSQQERGAGNLAPFTPAARAAHAITRTRSPVDAWVGRMGAALLLPHATPQARALGRQISAECEVLELAALVAYRRGTVRVPEAVRRRAASAH